MAEMNAATYLESGRKHVEGKDVNQAIKDLTEAIRLDPNCDEAYHLRSQAYYSRAVTHDQGRSIVYSLTVGAVQKKGDDDKAIADIRMAIKLAPKNNKHYAWLITILDDVGYGCGITISGRTLDPSEEINKRLRVIGILTVAALAIGLIAGGILMGVSVNNMIATGLATVLFALMYSIGIVPWLAIVKRNIEDIPDYFKAIFGAGLDSFNGGITKVIKSFLLALLVTLFWKPFKLLVIFAYLSPFIGVFQMVELLRDRRKER